MHNGILDVDYHIFKSDFMQNRLYSYGSCGIFPCLLLVKQIFAYHGRNYLIGHLYLAPVTSLMVMGALTVFMAFPAINK